MEDIRIDLPAKELGDLANRWSIEELALFGSVTREDFGDESDIDILVTFGADAGWSLWDLADLKSELERLLGHRVDLVEKRALLNPYRRRHILETARIIYAA
jgi:uncharacterized protein